MFIGAVIAAAVLWIVSVILSKRWQGAVTIQKRMIMLTCFGLAVIATIVAFVSGVETYGGGLDMGLVGYGVIILGLAAGILGLVGVLFNQPQPIIAWVTLPRLLRIAGTVAGAALLTVVTVSVFPVDAAIRPLLTALLLAAIVLFLIEFWLLNKGLTGGLTWRERVKALATAHRVMSIIVSLLVILIAIVWGTWLFSSFSWDFLKFWEWQWYVWLIIAFISFVICLIARAGSDFQAFMFTVGLIFLAGLVIDLVLSYSVAAFIIAVLIIIAAIVFGAIRFGLIGAILGGLVSVILLTTIFWVASIWVWPISVTSINPPTIGKWASTWSAPVAPRATKPTPTPSPTSPTPTPSPTPGKNSSGNGSGNTPVPYTSGWYPLVKQDVGIYALKPDGTPFKAVIVTGNNGVVYSQAGHTVPTGMVAEFLQGDTATFFTEGQQIILTSSGPYWGKFVLKYLFGAVCDAAINLQQYRVTNPDVCPASSRQPVTYGVVFRVLHIQPQVGMKDLGNDVLSMKSPHATTVTAPKGVNIVVVSVVNHISQVSIVTSGHSSVVQSGSSVIVAPSTLTASQLMSVVANHFSALTS